MIPAESRESDLLENLFPQYEAEGYEVFVHPSRAILPPFMQSYRPDAIAIKPDKKVAIEVKRSAQSSATKVQHLHQLFAPHSDWELRVYYISSRSSAKSPEIAPRGAIENAIGEVEELKRTGHQLSALLIAWAALEAVGRALLPEQFARPQTPARLIELLAPQ